MSGILTLLTDFGETYYPAVLKGVILSRCPDLQLIDITHNSPVFNIQAAAFTLAQVVEQFRMPSVHLVVVDPGVGTDRNAIAVAIGHGRFLVGPDNGVLSRAMPETGFEARKLSVSEHASMTFHGRDVFAPVAAALACNPETFLTLGERIEPMKLPLPHAEMREGKIHAMVLFVDHFGNIILSVHQQDRIVSAEKQLQVLTHGRTYHFQYGTYGKIGSDRLCWHYDSSGYIELSVGEGSFARFSGLGWEDSVILQQ